jgi:hypothetical protein
VKQHIRDTCLNDSKLNVQHRIKTVSSTRMVAEITRQ